MAVQPPPMAWIAFERGAVVHDYALLDVSAPLIRPKVRSGGPPSTSSDASRAWGCRTNLQQPADEEAVMDDPERQPGEAGRSTVVPAWVLGATNLFAMLVTAVLVGVALFLIGWLSPVLAPLGLGLFIAALAAPLFSRLVDQGRSAAVALTITVAVVLLVGAVVVAIALLSARSLSESMDAYAGAILARSADASGSGRPGGDPRPPVAGRAGGHPPECGPDRRRRREQPRVRDRHRGPAPARRRAL